MESPVQQEAKNLEGGCLCGAARYSIALDRLPPVYACHCLDCQTWSGSAFSLNCLAPEDALRLTGDLAVYERTTPSGFVSRQRFCAVCHARVYNTNSARPGMAVLRAGTLVRSDLLDVVCHIWTKRKQPWVGIAEGVPAWSESAPQAEFFALVMKR